MTLKKGYVCGLFLSDFDIDGLFDVLCDIFLYDVPDGFFHVLSCSEEASSWNAYCGSCLFECEELPELRFGTSPSPSQGGVTSLPFPAATVCLAVFRPKESFHLICDDDVASLVVYLGVW